MPSGRTKALYFIGSLAVLAAAITLLIAAQMPVTVEGRIDFPSMGTSMGSGIQVPDLIKNAERAATVSIGLATLFAGILLICTGCICHTIEEKAARPRDAA